jgi:hypothetical protein
LAPGCAERYCCAAPVAEETVVFTPAGLQSGAATADGAAEIPIATVPAMKPALTPAVWRRATVRLIFVISGVLRFDLNL